MREHGYNQPRFAKLLKLRQSTISNWLTRRSRPEPDHRLLLQRIVGIDANDWITADEIAAMDAVLVTAGVSKPSKAAKASRKRTGTEG